jgi:hypothetical protein
MIFQKSWAMTLPPVALLAPLQHSIPASVIQNNLLQSVSQFHHAGKSADQTKTGCFHVETAGWGRSIRLSGGL